MTAQMAQVKQLSKDAATRERRQSARTPVQNRSGVQALLVSGNLSYPVRLHDLSTTGAGFLLNRTLAVGTKLCLEITNSTRLFTCRRNVRVCHSTVLKNGAYLVGCEFAKPLDYQQVFALRCR